MTTGSQMVALTTTRPWSRGLNSDGRMLVEHLVEKRLLDRSVLLMLYPDVARKILLAGGHSSLTAGRACHQERAPNSPFLGSRMVLTFAGVIILRLNGEGKHLAFP